MTPTDEVSKERSSLSVWGAMDLDWLQYFLSLSKTSKFFGVTSSNYQTIAPG